MILKRNYFLLLFFFTAMFFTSCGDDDDAGIPVVAPTGSLGVGDQTIINGMITLDDVMISDDGWVVLYRDNSGTQGTEIVGQTFIEAGTYQDVMVELDTDADISDGETLWAALHVDINRDEVLDWDGTTGGDVPVRSGANNVSESFVVSLNLPGENSITAVDQPVTDNSITVMNVSLEESGWVVVHADADGGPGEVIGVSSVLAPGDHEDVVITLDDTAVVNVDDVLWIMLHLDNGVPGEYEFDGANGFDPPVLDENDDPIMTSITITE